jgi:hypothetical protein
MYHEFFAGKQLLSLPIVAMVFFAVTFAAVVVRVLVIKGRQASMRDDHLAHLPLFDDGSRAPATHEGDEK